MGIARTPSAREVDFMHLLRSNFAYEPTPSQELLMRAMTRFVWSQQDNCLLAVMGYAGTGKTTLVSALVQSLDAAGLRSVLLAPTGRAAKVLSNYSGRRAYTIHKKIYFRRKLRTGASVFELGENKHRYTVFVVDEASMIGDDPYSGSPGSSLLEDLMRYAYSGDHCRVLLVGDGAQLPPVSCDRSPALDLDWLKGTYPITAAMCELKEVTRQSAQSGILQLATHIRSALSAKEVRTSLPFQLPEQADVQAISGEELQDHLESAFGRYGQEGSLIITRSNKRAYQFNQSIRARVLFREEELSAGDLLMVVSNNYFFLSEDSKAGFIANGDVVEVLRLGSWEEHYGFRFLEASLRMVDNVEEPPFEALIWMDSLSCEAASMPQDARQALYAACLESYSDLPTKAERLKAVKSDPYFNALQVKFAYAVTCHKAQGGQWPAVFVDQGYLHEDMLDQGYLRWLYTAVSRATEQLFLLNFSPLIIDCPE